MLTDSVCQEFGKGRVGCFILLFDIWDLSKKDLKALIQLPEPRITWRHFLLTFLVADAGCQPEGLQVTWTSSYHGDPWLPTKFRTPKANVPRKLGGRCLAFYDLASEFMWCHFHHNHKPPQGGEHRSPHLTRGKSIRFCGMKKLDLVIYGKWNLPHLPCKWPHDKGE